MVSGQALHELEALLLESVASQQEAAKLCAAQWASKLFPLSHVPSRYVCVIAAGDAKLEVREAGCAGLQGPTPPLGEAGWSCPDSAEQASEVSATDVSCSSRMAVGKDRSGKAMSSQQSACSCLC